MPELVLIAIWCWTHRCQHLYGVEAQVYRVMQPLNAELILSALALVVSSLAFLVALLALRSGRR